MLSLIFNGNLKKKLEQRNISNNEFYLFERNLTKWLSNNTKNLNYEEMKYFKNASLATFSSGLFTGFLTKFILNKYKLINNKLSRNILCVFTGLYTSTFTINVMRKNIYLKLLDSNGPAGYASRNILKNTKEINLNYLNNFGEVIPLNNPNSSSNPSSTNSTSYLDNSTTTNPSNVNYPTNPTNYNKDNPNNPNNYKDNNPNNNNYNYKDNNPNNYKDNKDKKEDESWDSNLFSDKQETNFKTWDDIRNSNQPSSN